MSSYQYRKSHCGDKTILQPSYLHNGISYTGKMTSLYWIRTQITKDATKWHDNTAVINTLRPRQNGRHFPDDILKRIFLKENFRISIKISLKFVPKGSINNIPPLVQIMVWRRPGDKPLSEPMMVSLPTHICVTRPQWVNVQNSVLKSGTQYSWKHTLITFWWRFSLYLKWKWKIITSLLLVTLLIHAPGRRNTAH